MWSLNDLKRESIAIFTSPDNEGTILTKVI